VKGAAKGAAKGDGGVDSAPTGERDTDVAAGLRYVYRKRRGESG
jgi:hypothetical protein